MYYCIQEGAVISANNLKCDDISAMHGSIWLLPFPPPPGKPRDKSSPSAPGVRYCLKQFFPGDIKRVRKIKNIFSLILRSTCHFSRGLDKWLRTSRLRIFKGKPRNLSEIDWRRITYIYQYLSLYLKACFKISKRMRMVRTQMDFFWKRMKEIFFQPSFNNKAT